MNNYRGQVRRQGDSGSRISIEGERNNFQSLQQDRYCRNNDFERSELSYYQSEVSHSLYQQEGKSDRNRSALENNQIYDKLIPVRVQSADSEQYSTYLRIQIINAQEKGLNKLTLYLTDDRNPKFLWIFFVKENDFMVLKKQQKLKVDFRAFPSLLTYYFDMCKGSKETSNSLSNELYFFSLFEIKKNEACLNIAEANKYKESIHLSLKCKLGNDEQIKQYLSQKLLKAESQNASLQSKISYQEQMLNTRKEQIVRLQIELKQEKKTNQKGSEEFQIQMTRVQTELRREKLENEQKLKKAHQKEFKQMKHNLEQQLQKYSKAHEELKLKYEASQQKLAAVESKERQSTFQISTKTKEIQNYLKLLEQAKAQAFKLQHARTQNQKTIIEQKVKIESLESQISDKLKIIESNVELKSTNSHQISSLESKILQYKKQIQKQESKIQSLQSQIHKLSQTVEDYREKYEKKKQKNQEKNNIIKQQERYINQKENELLQFKRHLQNKQKLIDQAKIQSDDKNRKINDLKRQIEECQKKIKEDNDLITHLQKQLNERTIGIRPGFTSTSSYQRSTSPFTSNVSANREYLATNMSLGNTSSSRLKFTSSGDNNSQQAGEKVSRKQIQIKRYIPTNEEKERSKSPVLNSRLNQQKEPEQSRSTGVVKPVKFKFSQRQ